MIGAFLIADTPSPAPWVIPVLALSASVIAFFVAILAPRHHPKLPRMAEDESSLSLLPIAGFGLLAWSGSALLLGPLLAPHNGKGLQYDDPGVIELNAVIDIAAFMAMAFGAITQRPQGLRRMGLDLKSLPWGMLLGIGAMLIAMPMVLLIANYSEWIMHRLHIEHPTAHPFLSSLQSHPKLSVLTIVLLSAVVAAPLAEEMFFRGVAQTIFRFATRNQTAAILLSSLLFASVHQTWTWGPIFFLGLCLGYLYERSGNLWACIVAHAVFNLASVLDFWATRGHV